MNKVIQSPHRFIAFRNLKIGDIIYNENLKIYGKIEEIGYSFIIIKINRFELVIPIDNYTHFEKEWKKN